MQSISPGPRIRFLLGISCQFEHGFCHFDFNSKTQVYLQWIQQIQLKIMKIGGEIHMAQASILSTIACLRTVRPTGTCNILTQQQKTEKYFLFQECIFVLLEYQQNISQTYLTLLLDSHLPLVTLVPQQCSMSSFLRTMKQ